MKASWILVTEAAQMLDTTRDYVYQLAKQGRLVARGKHPMKILKKSVESFDRPVCGECGARMGNWGTCQSCKAALDILDGAKEVVLEHDPSQALVMGYGRFPKYVFVNGARHGEWPEESLWKCEPGNQRLVIRNGMPAPSEETRRTRVQQGA